MKKIILFFVLLAFAGRAYAQDIITMVDGSDIQADVVEINHEDIRYKRWDNQDGPVFVMPKSQVLMILYENGARDVFNVRPEPVSLSPYAEVQPGMRYRDYEQFYNPRDYVYATGDRYSPVAGGICSWLIPGLGQMVNGEVGRGFAYLGGAAGCAVLTSVGAMLAAEGLIYMTSGQGYKSSVAIAGVAIMYAGLAGLVIVDICAIVDGVRVAKIKNMYERDVRTLSSVMSIDLQPYIATTAGVDPTNVYGASLRITF